ncbi:MAG: hypothetical protein ACJ77Z_01240, partial [Thermoleophilaceae bacterium]
GCGTGSAWRSAAFSWREHREETPHGFKPFPDCGPDYTRTDYDSRLIRYYEDSTWLSAGASQIDSSEGDGITPQNAAAMTRCGVDLLGFDQLVPGDGRLDAVVWSWAEDEPSRGDCAAMRADGRWTSAGCKRKLRAACRRPDGSWIVTERAVKERDAAESCATSRAEFAVPRTGFDNESLALVAAGARVWLAVTRTQ